MSEHRANRIGRVCLAALLMSVSMVQAGPGLSVGAARRDITPDVQLSNWVTHKPYGEVMEPVFARAMVFAQETNRVAIVTWDLVYAMEGAVVRVRKRIAQETGIPERNILVSATHNHSAPWSPILGDPLTGAERKVLESFMNDPLYDAWTEKLMSETVKAVAQADAGRRAASLTIGRANAGELLFNRRPIKPDGTVEGLATPADPLVLPRGLRFGPMDSTLTVLVFRDPDQKPIVTLFHVPCHAVAVYPSYDGVSCDWPGTACEAVRQQLGGEAVFLQGCAGDIVPARRGIPARDQMAKTIADRVVSASKVAQGLTLTNAFEVRSRRVKAPVTEVVRADTGREYFTPEVQVMSSGPLALVALPGEPLISLALAIQKRSPFPHTIVLGYANGYGTQYVGLPGDKAKGGYEMGSRNLGTDECGKLLVEAAVELLNERPNF